MSPEIRLYTFGTTNGHKVSILLELLGVKYSMHLMDVLSSDIHKEEWFTKLNPNGRIPTLVDESTSITISESGAILQYLVDTYDSENRFSYKIGTPLYFKQLELMHFQTSGVGTMQDELHHYTLYAKEKIPYAIERYLTETLRLYSVLDEILSRNASNGPYLVGDHISIADIAGFTWAGVLHFYGVDVHQWPYVAKWFDILKSIPEVQRGLSKLPRKGYKLE